LSSITRNAPEEQRQHFERAIQIFEEMGAAYDLELAKTKASENGITL
jgi:hypothetical protein